MFSLGQYLTGIGVLIELGVVWQIIKSLPTEEELRSQETTESLDHLSGSGHSKFYEDTVQQIRQIQIPILIALILQFIGAFL